VRTGAQRSGKRADRHLYFSKPRLAVAKVPWAPNVAAAFSQILSPQTNLMKKLGILLLILSSSSSAVLGQEATQPASSSAPAPASTPATKPDARKLALAHDTIRAMQAEKGIEAMGTRIKQMALQMSGLAPAAATPEQKAQAERIQSRITDLSTEALNGLLGKMDELYAEGYSEAELQATKTFFSSPEGKALLSKQPQLMQRFGPLVQQMQREIMPKIQAIVAEEKAAQEKAAAAAAPAPTPAPAPVPVAAPAPASP